MDLYQGKSGDLTDRSKICQLLFSSFITLACSHGFSEFLFCHIKEGNYKPASVMTSNELQWS